MQHRRFKLWTSRSIKPKCRRRDARVRWMTPWVSSKGSSLWGGLQWGRSRENRRDLRPIKTNSDWIPWQFPPMRTRAHVQSRPQGQLKRQFVIGEGEEEGVGKTDETHHNRLWLDPLVVSADDDNTPVLVKGLWVSSKGTWLSRDGKEEEMGEKRQDP